MVVTELIVNAENVKKSYISGETLDTAGLEVKVKYNNGNENVITNYTCTPTTLTAETKTITVSYNGGEFIGTYDVTVKERDFVITKYPTKRNYTQGDSLDLTGLKVMQVDTDNTKTDITNECRCSPTILNEVGNETITIIYGENKEVGTFVVNVEKGIDSIEINEKLSTVKKEYIQGQNLNTEGLVLKVKYTDGSIDENVTEGIRYSNVTLDEIGTKEITISYGGKTAKYNVTVSKKEVTNIKFNGTTKNSYYKGDPLDVSSIALTVTYNDGEILQINNENYDEYDITYMPTVMNNVGSQKITVTYEGKSAEFDVTVQDVKLEELNLTKLPTRLKYHIGEKVYTDGLELEAIYSNGENVKITRGYKCTPEEFTTIGTQKVDVTYGDKRVSFDVEVTDGTLQKLEIQQMPYNIDYYVGNILDFTGLILKATYSDGDVRIVELDELNIPKNELLKAGTQKVHVDYEDKNVSIDVTVKDVEITEIIDINNLKESYKKGETLNTDELVLIARDAYDNVIEINASKDKNVEISPIKLDTVGEQEITVKYKNALPYTFKVNVEEANSGNEDGENDDKEDDKKEENGNKNNDISNNDEDKNNVNKEEKNTNLSDNINSKNNTGEKDIANKNNYQDANTAKSKLPQTGVGQAIIIAIIVVIIISTIAGFGLYIGYKKSK